MNIVKIVYCRIYQKILFIAAPFLKWRKPEILEFENGIKQLPQFIKSKGIERILLVSGQTTKKLGLLDNFIDSAKQCDLTIEWYYNVSPNPTFDNVYQAEQLYKNGKCQAIVAFGGGSPIDCAKIVGARIARPKKSIQKMKGLMKINRKLPTFFAIPTTSGSGSETTLASVMTNSQTHEKFAINDPVLIPNYAVMDSSLTIGLSKHLTATTGIDALTHSVEAYIGRSNTPTTKNNAEKSVKLIFESLETAYNQPQNQQARKNMQLASFCAGVAFTRAYVGYVHAIAHALGGYYNLAHGLANAILLPHVLESYGKSAYKKLGKLSIAANIGDKQNTDKQNSQLFIDKIKQMNKNMQIPNCVEQLKAEDIPILAKRAEKEANPLYPVPKILGIKQIENILKKLVKDKNS